MNETDIITYNDVSIHFQTKTQTIEEIEKKLDCYFSSDVYKGEFDFSEERDANQNRNILHHCFIREGEEDKFSFPKDVKKMIRKTHDFLGMLCEERVQWADSSPFGLERSRLLMLENIKRCGGMSLFIGDIQGGVEDEFKLVEELGIFYIKIR